MRLSSYVIVSCVLLLGGCSPSDIQSDKQKALKAYTACLRGASTKTDDGKKSAFTVAVAISPMCASEFQTVIQVNNTQNRKDFEMAMDAKQLDFATAVVLEERKTRSSN